MKGFNVFQKGVHRIPTLALYKSLLKLSTNPSLDPGLSKRLGKQIRSQFRKNKKCYSPRLVKGYLIQAYETHSMMEKAIQGDTEALSALIDRWSPKRLKRSADTTPTPKITLPEKPPIMGSAEGIPPKVPALHYPTFTLPWMIYPGSRHSSKAGYTILRPLEANRKLGQIHGLLLNYIYYAQFEEKFLRQLAKDMNQQWGWDTEAGVREMKSMSYDIGKYIADVELRENIKTELRLKEWARQNAGVKFLPQGRRMPRQRRRELRLWRQKVDEAKREQREQAQKTAFMRDWSRGLGSGSSISTFRHPHGRKSKRRAKRIRRVKLGNKLL